MKGNACVESIGLRHSLQWRNYWLTSSTVSQQCYSVKGEVAWVIVLLYIIRFLLLYQWKMARIGVHLRKLSQIKTGVSIFWTTL